MTYIVLPETSGSGSEYYGDPVADVASLPPAGVVSGEVRLVLDSLTFYVWDGSAWVRENQEALADSVADVASLPVAGEEVGQLILVRDIMMLYAWDGSAWVREGERTLRELVPVTDGSSAGAGEIGEVLTGTQAALTTTGVGATGDWGAATSVTLTAGEWRLSGVALLSENGAVLTGSVCVGISASATGDGMGSWDYGMLPYMTTGDDAQVVTPSIEVSLGAGTTYYLNTKFSYTSGTPEHAGRIRARRIG